MEEKTWKSKIASFDHMVESLSINDKVCEELLFDILQDLFSEDLIESSRLEILLLIQQYEDQLIGDIDKAIQVSGSLLNVYDFLNNHLVLLKSQLLVTITGICINFDLTKLSESFYNDLVNVLVDSILKSKSAAAHPILCKTAADCLCMFEDSNPGLLLKHLQNILVCLKNERSFAIYSDILVVASIVNNILKTESLNDDESSIDFNKTIAQLIKGMGNCSSPGLVFMLRKIIPCLHKSKISKSVINNLLLYCMPSWDLARVYVYIYFQRNYQFIFQSNDDVNMIPVIAHLTMLIDMNHLTSLHVLIIQYWMAEYVRTIHSSNTYTEACLIATQALEPNIYAQLHYFPGKVSTLLQILKRNSNMFMSYEKQAMIFRVLVSHSKHMHWYDKMSDLFHSFFILYKNGTLNIQEDIIQVVEKLTIESLKLAMYTIDFCSQIDDQKSSNTSSVLLTNIVKGLVSLDEKDIFLDLKSFFLILEQAAAVKDICPLQIIESLKAVAKHLAQKNNNWHDGSLLLSICRNMIINYDEEKIRHEISTLLWYITTSFPSQFIHDRAMAYYLIIGKMSPHHYKEVLTMSLLNQSVTKTDGDVSNMAEAMSQGPLHIRKYKQKFLSLKIKDPLVKMDYKDGFFNAKNRYEILEAYNSTLESDVFDKDITHKCFLSIYEKGPIYNIFAIQLDLFTINGPFEPTSIYCPFLKKSNEEGEEICISFKPQLPNVAKFELRATFIDEKHNSWITYLDPLQLEFYHLFKPIQFGSSDKVQLFEALWKHFEDNENIPIKAPSLSVKNIGLVSKTTVSKCLKNYIVSESENIFTVGIYLPPRNHILLKFQFNSSNTVAWIATDDVMLLEDIDTYLEKFSD